MKKKLLALLLTAAMAIQPLSVAGAAEFTDGSAETVEDAADEFIDGVDEAAMVEEVEVPEAKEAPSENAIQMGDDVWVEFDDTTSTATISGSGDMWDYLQDGATLDKHENPFNERTVRSLVIGDEITHISDYLLGKSWGMNSVTLGKKVKSIGKYAFSQEGRLSSISIPEGVEEIGEGSFEGCSGLQEIVLPDSVNSLGRECFTYCDGLKNITFSDSLNSLPEYCFSHCISLTKIDISGNIENINDGVFEGCEGLETIVLQSGVKLIGAGAFGGCSRLTNINLPDTIEEIDNNTFRDCIRLETVALPKSLKKIGYGAFANCLSLDDVTVPETVKDLSGTFSGCTALTNVTLFEGLESIGESAFYGCIRLKEIKIPNSVVLIDTEWRDPFERCDNLTKIYSASCSAAKKYYDSLPEEQKAKITFVSTGEGVHQWSASKINVKYPTCTETGLKAYQCSRCGVLKEEEEVKALGHEWEENKIIKEPTETEDGVMQYLCWRCNATKEEAISKLSAVQLRNIYVSWNNYSELRIRFTPNKEISYYTTYVKQGEQEPAYDEMRVDGKANADQVCWATLSSIPDEAVDAYIFATDAEGNHVCVKVLPDYYGRPEKPSNTIRVGDNVYGTIVGDTLTLEGSGDTYDAWIWEDRDVRSVHNIVVEEGITRLGSGSLSGFTSVTQVQLPGSLRTIGTGAFQSCSSLESIVIPEGIVTMENDIFQNCASLRKISFPSTLNTIPELGTVYYMEGPSTGLPLEEVTIERGVKKIAENAFIGCSSLKTIELPDTITSIGTWAFCGCTSLEKINLPEGLTELGVYVFDGCNSLKELVFPASLKNIPSLCGESGSGISSVTIPEGVEIIGDYAFFLCHNLKNVQLPSSIKNIESGAFSDSGITSFDWPDSVTIIPSGVFQNSALEEFSVPATVTSIENGAFSYCANLTKITIPDTVKYFGNDVFRDSRNLTIYGDRDSAAERYAYTNNIPFVSDCFKVIFKDNGRTQKTEYVKEGEDATPPMLTKAGYTLSWDGDYKDIREDMIINAIWTKIEEGDKPGEGDKPEPPIIVYPPETTKYTVTFVDRGKTIKTEKVASGEAADLPYLYRHGYELSWDKDFSKVTSNMTVNAVWTVIKPAKVTSLTAEVLAKTIRLSWDEDEYAGYYLVYRKAAADKDFAQVGKTANILWTDRYPKRGTQYQYKVVAVRSLEGKKYQSPDSELVSAKLGTPQTGAIYTAGKLNYKVMNASEVRVTGMAKPTASLSIPNSVSIAGKSFKVTSIDHKAFYENEDLINLKIGSNITYIGQYSFYQCPNLESVKFGSRVQNISTCAFTHCPKLGNVSLPASVTRLGAKAFYKCAHLRVMTVNAKALEYLGKNALAIRSSVQIRLPKAKYTAYKKMIQRAGAYKNTRFVKF